MKNLIVSLLLSSVFAAPAFADDTGFYIGANAGQARSDYTGSKNATAFLAEAGYKYSSNLAFDAQYGAFGDIAASGAGSEKASGFKLAVVGILPFTEQWSLLGNFGVGYIDTKLSGTGITDGTYSRIGFTYGVGGQYNFNRQLGVRLGVDRYQTGGSQGGGYGGGGTSMSLASGTLTVVYLGVNYLLF